MYIYIPRVPSSVYIDGPSSSSFFRYFAANVDTMYVHGPLGFAELSVAALRVGVSPKVLRQAPNPKSRIFRGCHGLESIGVEPQIDLICQDLCNFHLHICLYVYVHTFIDKLERPSIYLSVSPPVSVYIYT